MGKLAGTNKPSHISCRSVSVKEIRNHALMLSVFRVSLLESPFCLIPMRLIGALLLLNALSETHAQCAVGRYQSVPGADFIVVTDRNRIRKVTLGSTPEISLVVDVGWNNPDFLIPRYCAVVPDGKTVLVTDERNRIFSVDLTTGVYTWVAGGSQAVVTYYHVEGTGIYGIFNDIYNFDKRGNNFYVSSRVHNYVQKLTIPGWVVTNVIGVDNVLGVTDGIFPGTGTLDIGRSFASPDETFFLQIPSMNQIIRKVTIAKKLVETLVGQTDLYASCVDGVGRDARLGQVTNIAMADNATAYFYDWDAKSIRKLDIAARRVTSWVGNCAGSGTLDVAGTGTSARFTLHDMSITSDGATIYALSKNGPLWKINTTTSVVTQVMELTILQSTNPQINVYQTCALCTAVGSYCAGGSLTTQVPCPVGSYCVNPSSKVACFSGDLCPTGSTSRTPCPIGNYCPDWVRTIACSAGSYCPAGSASPQACPAGALDCNDPSAPRWCPLGYYCLSPIDIYSCAEDYPGSYCPPGTSNPQPCPAGYVCPDPSTINECSSGSGYYCPGGSSPGGICAAGYYCPTAAVQILCDPGYLCPAKSWKQTPCPIGYYCPTFSTKYLCTGVGNYCGGGAVPSVQPCPAGNYCPNITTKYACNAGTYCGAGLTAQAGICPSGSYCETPATKVSCSLGSYCGAGSTQMQPCPAGSYCPTVTSIVSCDAGKFCISGLTAAGPACSIGSYCPAGSSSSQPCAAGYRCPTTTSTFLCSAGTYCPPGSSSAITCTLGNYCIPGSSAPASCDLGSYCPPGSTAMIQCPGGSFCVNASTYQSCPAGAFCIPGSIAPSPCAAGMLCAAGSSSESPCPAGSVCLNSSAATRCAIGFFCSAGSSVAQTCPLGTYCEPGSTSALPCPAGYYCVNSTVKAACLPGDYCDQGSTQRSLCPAGRRCPDPSTIVLCDPGTLCREGSTTAQNCELGSYCAAGSSVAIPCPAGSVCYSPATIAPCELGFLCPVSSTFMTPCPKGKYCPGTLTAMDCPSPSITFATGAMSHLNCTCPKGFFGRVSSPTVAVCNACPLGQFCAGVSSTCTC